MLLLSDSNAETAASDALADPEDDPEADADSLALLEVRSERIAEAESETDPAIEAEVLREAFAASLASFRD